jgi:FkbM family methyltransferase
VELLGSVKRRLKKHVNKALENAMGVRLYSVRAHAREDWYDIRKSGCRIENVFDVGANIGQSMLKFRDAFPKANIYCFEPVRDLFQELHKTVRGDSHVQCFQVALGSAPGIGKIYLTDHSTTSSLIKPENSRGVEDVQIDTIDSFCSAHATQRIDLLKVDAEGFDLEVLKGGVSLLSSARVAFVLVEVGFHPGDTRHVLFDHAREFLMPHGFHVYGFYDQNLEWSGESRLRFANVCFANETAFHR